jgi:hypothetical protein
MPVYAHPPKEVTLELGPNGALTVRVLHSVDDPGKHYVSRITVYVDDRAEETREYKSQTGTEGMSDIFALDPPRSGANIRAEAFCVIMGSKTGSFIVP